MAQIGPRERDPDDVVSPGHINDEFVALCPTFLMDDRDEAFRKAINLKPDYAIAHRDLGFAMLRTGDMMGARKEFQKYVDLDPRGKDVSEIKATIKSLDSAK
jgi:tetratricopeptide (TPR) repeat protein